MGKASSLSKHIALLGFALLFILLMAEAALRITTPPTFRQRPFLNFPWVVYDPIVRWQNKPDFEAPSVQFAGARIPIEWRINHQGFRGPALEHSKKKGTIRIVCLGDSGTFGIWRGTNLETDPPELRGGFDGYPDELRKILRGRGGNEVEVINGGVLGYSSAHGLRQLTTQLLEIDPDVMTVRFGMNDHGLAWDSSLAVHDPESLAGRFLLQHFHGWRLYRLLASSLHRLKARNSQSYTTRWVSPYQFEENLRRFVEIARDEGIELLFVDYPLRPIDAGKPLSRYQRRLLLTERGVASKEAFYALHAGYQAVLERVVTDTSSQILRSTETFDASPTPVFSDDDLVHPNRHGAKLLAQLLFDELAGLGWLGR